MRSRLSTVGWKEVKIGLADGFGFVGNTAELTAFTVQRHDGKTPLTPMAINSIG
jgi:hypothetical protein